MTVDGLRTALSQIEKPDGEGYHVRVYIGGSELEGAICAPGDNGLVRLESHADSFPTIIDVAAINAIERID